MHKVAHGVESGPHSGIPNLVASFYVGSMPHVRIIVQPVARKVPAEFELNEKSRVVEERKTKASP